MRVVMSLFSAVLITAAVSAVGAPSTPDIPYLMNLSLRGFTGQGSETLIPGFVVGQRGRFLIRAVGQGLLGPVPTMRVCKDPRFTLYNGTKPVIQNDDWDADPANAAAVTAACTESGAFPLQAGSKDAAVVVTLGPGAYTFPIGSTVENAGVALAEVYNLDQLPHALVNLSARGLVRPGQNNLIPGCVIGGGGHARIMYRAVGPTLVKFGVTGILPDPFITLYHVQEGVSQKVTEDDDSNTWSKVFEVFGAFPLPAPTLDAVIGGIWEFRDYPANYTLVTTASSKSSVTEGVVLDEIYLMEEGAYEAREASIQ